MTEDDIIKMALVHFGAVITPSDLEYKLAALVAAAEREACAKICEKYQFDFVARDIRKRGEPDASTALQSIQQ